MEDLIAHVSEILDDLHGRRPAALSIKSITPPSVHQSLQEQPLPIPPEESPSGVDYGSSFTKVMTLPPRSSASSSREAEPRTSTSTSREQDFTPTLPSRPTPSIHPSRRAGTSASIRSDTSASDPRSPSATSFRESAHEESGDLHGAHPRADTGDSVVSDYASAYGTLQSTSASPTSEKTEETAPKLSESAMQTHSSSDSSQSTASTIVPSDNKI